MKKKEFKPGEIIPKDLIIKRYRDTEFDGILLEIKGEKNSFYRTTEDNRYLFKVDRDVYPENELNEMEVKNSNSSTRDDDDQLPDYLKPYVRKAFILKNDKEIHVYDSEFNLLGRISTNGNGKKKQTETTSKTQTPEDDIKKLNEGDLIPQIWRQLCQKEKEGYSLRVGQILLRINNQFKIKKKIPLTNPVQEEIDKYEKTEQLLSPATMPEEEILDFDEKTQESIKVTFKGEPPIVISPQKIVQKIIGKFRRAIQSNKLKLDYFVEKKLALSRYDSLTKVLKGHLQFLNEETKEGMKTTPHKSIKGGLSLLKAALIHELYINSTVTGRNAGEGQAAESGKNLKSLWTFLTLLQHDSSIRPLGEEVDQKGQRDLIEFLGKLKGKYKDKSEVIERIYQKLMFDLKNGYLTYKKRNTSIDKFKAILIYKFYENTNRLDRGDGITMICIVREIIDYYKK